jgi:hypothetical protein
LLTVGNVVAIGIAGSIASGENEVDDPNRVGDIHNTIAVYFARFQWIGSIAADEDVVDDIYSIADIHSFIAVGVAAYIHIITGISDTISIRILLAGIIMIRAVVLAFTPAVPVMVVQRIQRAS